VASAGDSQTIGTPTAAATGNAIGDHTDACYDANSNKVIVVYYQGSQGSGACNIGTVSGNTISFGSKVIFNSSDSSYMAVACDDSTGKIMIAFKSDYDRAYGIIGVVSGTSVSFGTRVTAENGVTFFNNIVFDSNQNRFVHVYKGNNQGGPVAIIGTVSGTNTLTYNGETTIDSDASNPGSLVFDPNSNKVVACYRDNGIGKMVVRVGTVTGAAAISFGSEVQIDSNNWWEMTASFDSSVNKIVFVGADQTGGTNYGVSMCGTVSGTSISVGSKYIFRSAAIQRPSITYAITANRHVVSYVNASGVGEITIGTLAGTALSWTTSTINFTGATGAVNNISAVYDPNTSRHVTWYRDGAASGVGTGVTFTTPWSSINLTSTNFIGTSEGAFADTATATVMLRGGITTTQSGLTIGSKYYVQTDGTLSTTPDSPSVTAGKALTSTTLLIGGSS
jgi:hypothetical protein